MKALKHLSVVFGGLLVIGLLLWTVTGPEKASDELVNFAQCLTENNVIMYGTEWCPHCKTQKEMFKSALDDITYVDCDKYSDICSQNEVQSYPQWIKDGDLSNKLKGTQSLASLADFSGCTFR